MAATAPDLPDTDVLRFADAYLPNVDQRRIKFALATAGYLRLKSNRYRVTERAEGLFYEFVDSTRPRHKNRIFATAAGQAVMTEMANNGAFPMNKPSGNTTGNTETETDDAPRRRGIPDE